MRRLLSRRIWIPGSLYAALPLLYLLLGAFAVALVDDEDVGDLEQPRFHRLDIVAETRCIDDDPHIRDFSDVDLALANAHRLDEDEIK